MRNNAKDLSSQLIAQLNEELGEDRKVFFCAHKDVEPVLITCDEKLNPLESIAWKELFDVVNFNSFLTYLLKTFGKHIIEFGGEIELSRAKFTFKKLILDKLRKQF
jgi:hypothetical protein